MPHILDPNDSINNDSLKNYDDTIELACELIARKSITPDDCNCQKILINRLLQLGFQIEDMSYGNTTNLWARRGIRAPLLVFAGHTDVVPAGDHKQWLSDPFSPTIKDGYIYGRGAADMKGSLAAMVVAVENFINQHPNHLGSIAFLITSAEEDFFTNGTIRVVKTLLERNEIIDMCIVGEPSSSTIVGDVIKNGRRGSITGDLTIFGSQGHVAYPHLADNPIHKSLLALNELVNITWDNGNDYFSPTSLQVVNINAGTGATNVIPSEFKVQFNLRFSSEINYEIIKQKINGIFASYDFLYDINWHYNGEPFLTTSGQLLDATINAVKSVNNITPQLLTTGGTSDGRFIAKIPNVQVIELGPVNTTIHQVNECVKINDLIKLTKMYQHILINLLFRKTL